MVGLGDNPGALQHLAAADNHAVVCGLAIDTHGLKVAHHGVDAVALLDLELGSVPDDGGAFGAGCKHCNHRYLINQGRNNLATDLGAMKLAVRYEQVADLLARDIALV